VSAVLTERPRTVLRRAWFWVAAAALVLAFAGVSVIVGGADTGGVTRSPTNPAPAGSRALAEVLQAHGIEVVIPTTLAEAVAAASESGSTLLLDDPGELIGSDGNSELRRTGARVVLVAPTSRTLIDYDDIAQPASTVEDEDAVVDADCDYGPARLAGAIDGAATTYQVLTGAGTVSCWVDADGAARVVVHEDGLHPLIVLGTTGLLENQRILDAGDAAFALGVLGATPRLVWFQPQQREGWGDDPGDATIGSVSPGWVIPVMALLVATVVAAAIWRGRRFGPLVVEPLPAVVPADETVRGRARLYTRANARLRALDAIRIGTIGRLAAALGQGANASVEQVAAGVATVTGRPLAEVLELLRDRTPANDRELLQCSDALRRLETELNGRMRP